MLTTTKLLIPPLALGAATATGWWLAGSESQRLQHENPTPATTTTMLWPTACGRVLGIAAAVWAFTETQTAQRRWEPVAALAIIALIGPAVTATDMAWRQITRRCNITAMLLTATALTAGGAVTGQWLPVAVGQACCAIAMTGYLAAETKGLVGGGDVLAVGWTTALIGWANGAIAAAVMVTTASLLTGTWALATDTNLPLLKRSTAHGPALIASTLTVLGVLSL